MMLRFRVTVVPVVLRPIDDDPQTPHLAVSMLRPSGDWLDATVPDAAAALSTARRLLDEAVPEDVDAGDVRMENAGVDYSSGEPNLLFTAVLPIAAAELRGTTNDWSLLTPWADDGPTRAALLRLDPVQAAMVHYWRDRLVQTTAAFDFLPRYFTTSQARSVYSSVWGESQADGNFQRWLASARDVNGMALCEGVSDVEVRREAQTAFAERVAKVGLTAEGVTKAWDVKFVGVSAGVGALSGVASIPAAAVAGAIVGSLIGWQRAKGAGRPPSWYHTTRSRIDLKTWYPVRPPAAKRPPGFVA
ncbi:hypothetical protein [Cryobacterium sp. Hz9]|uniref:hypothetical protein n=1 Tax=Cryobacterium sp. Hz9 TaxID=1259167 RepID=UPI00106A28C7|nr:hypothetical protein [Cryobacterium sp. Hz9]TFB66188.1 hypothetical protein E3N85_10120 [Cryobacterium sp. Hz9]